MPGLVGSEGEEIYVQLNHPKQRRGFLHFALKQAFGFCALSCEMLPKVFSHVSRRLTIGGSGSWHSAVVLHATL